MRRLHYLRVGAMGQIGRFHSAEGIAWPRASRVVVRTARGLEVGEVLSDDPADGPSEGPILRAMTVEDELLESRLQKNRDQAYQACATRIDELRLPVALMDVEHLFDGQSLIFYYLGDATPEMDRITAELAEVYETKAQFRRFTETLVAGCGPDCGTESAGGCTSCGTGCALSGACGSKTGATD